MPTMTLDIPGSQINWFEQMVRTMGWSFRREGTAPGAEKPAITPAMRRRIAQARKESKNGETITCRTAEEMQRYFDSL